KEQQSSDWSLPELSAEQMTYASEDVRYLRRLARTLGRKLQEADLARVEELERRCLPALVWLATSGGPFNRDAWQALIDQSLVEAKELKDQLDAQSPPRPPDKKGRPQTWNWASPAQVRQVFTALGISLESSKDETLAVVTHPLAALLRRHRSAVKLASAYG